MSRRLVRFPMYLAATILVASAGCISSDILRLDPQPRPATVAEQVRVFAVEPATPYRVIALVSVSTPHSLHGRGVDALHGRLRKEAARLGGEAVVFDASSLQRRESETILSAKVIVFDKETH